jgi:hypothetical protein
VLFELRVPLFLSRAFVALPPISTIPPLAPNPLRVLIYENQEGKTRVEYDRPSSLFGQFGNAKITAIAVMLDGKLEALVTKAIESR